MATKVKPAIDNGQATNRIAEVEGGKISQTAIMIPRIQPCMAKFTIVGTAPLVVCAWSHKARKQILDKQMFDAAKEGGRLKKAKHEPKKPEEDYQASLYKSSDGWTGIPASGVKGCLVNACRGVDGLPMTVAQRMMFVKADGISTEGQGLVRIRGEHHMHEGMVRIDRGESVDIRFRAMYDNWEIDLCIEYLQNLISVQAIGNLIETAGFIEGLCEWRPGAPKSKTGEWGRFQLKRSE
jgi:hypothetical protein